MVRASTLAPTGGTLDLHSDSILDGGRPASSPGGHRLRVWQQTFVWIWAAISLAVIYIGGRHSELDRHVTNRLQFHAIPVALSVLYHGRTHDYTAYSSVAIPFQTPAPDVDTKIARAIGNVPPPGDSTYYWVADDRGMSQRH